MLTLTVAAPLLVLQASASACTIPDPEFSMTTEPDENIAAEVYLPCEGQDAEGLVNAFIEREGKPIESEITFDERDVEVAMTGLSEPEGDEKTAIIRRAEQVDDTKPYVCRVHKPTAGDAAAWRAVQWCLTFVVGPTMTVKIKPPETPQEQEQAISTI
ncbi:hypothetical protein [uncultured Erythrobacter sp.]|uniref:hypothetical protein n=1 Tax=uncultured Erythrobacter sp. TaxID=263913 RepID=UPI00262C6408|nr:hypothetical protein [uncultured Erythrobacter sp.]